MFRVIVKMTPQELIQAAKDVLNNHIGIIGTYDEGVLRRVIFEYEERLLEHGETK